MTVYQWWCHLPFSQAFAVAIVVMIMVSLIVGRAKRWYDPSQVIFRETRRRRRLRRDAHRFLRSTSGRDHYNEFHVHR